MRKSTPQFSSLTVTLIFLLFVHVSFGQKDSDQVTPLRTTTQLSDPPPSGFAPVLIGKTEAAEEADMNSAAAGFRAVFFGKEALAELMSNKEAVGVRFYNALEDSKSGMAALIAVAIRADGTEINPFGKRAYYVSQQDLSSKLVSKTTAKSCVENCSANKQLTSYTAFFSNSTLTEMMNQAGANGVALLPSSRRFTLKDGTVSAYKSMMIAPASSDGAKVNEIGGIYYKSLEPCPYFCPDDKYLLTPARY